MNGEQELAETLRRLKPGLKVPVGLRYEQAPAGGRPQRGTEKK